MTCWPLGTDRSAMKYKIPSGAKTGAVAALVSKCMLLVRNWCAPHGRAQLQKRFCGPLCGASSKGIIHKLMPRHTHSAAQRFQPFRTELSTVDLCLLVQTRVLCRLALCMAGLVPEGANRVLGSSVPICSLRNTSQLPSHLHLPIHTSPHAYLALGVGRLSSWQPDAARPPRSLYPAYLTLGRVG